MGLNKNLGHQSKIICFGVLFVVVWLKRWFKTRERESNLMCATDE